MAASFALGTGPVLDSVTKQSTSSISRIGAAGSLTSTSSSSLNPISSKSLVVSFPRLCLSFRHNLSHVVARRVSMAPESALAAEHDEGGDEDEEEEVEERNEPPPVMDDSGYKLFVGNLSYNVDSQQLAGLFQEAGEVNMVEVIYDRPTGRSRGFGFVTMATEEGCKTAFERFNGYELDGRALRVNSGPPPPKDFSSPRGSPRESYGGNRESFGGNRESFGGNRERFGGGGGGGYADSENRIFVGNLPWSADDLSLQQLFNDYGTVLNTRVVTDRATGRSRGFGFVTMSSREEVEKAIANLNGTDLDGRQLRVDSAEARPPRF